jgi:hypothetical protein
MPRTTPLDPEALLIDAAALFSFIDSICLHCRHDGQSPAYLSASEMFFDYTWTLADATKAYLNVFPEMAPRDQRLYAGHRQKLETIRLAWFELHSRIQAATDADTLNFPYTLVEALTRRLNRVDGLENTQFAILHFDELNYFEVPVSDMQRTATGLSSIIPDCPEFPPNLGLIGIPYSQASSLYLNCLIAHEMGHFVFEHSDVYQDLLRDIERVLRNERRKHTLTVSRDELHWCKDRLSSWAEELFRDLFATWLIGPCFSLAFVEVFGLTAVLKPAGAKNISGMNEADTFFEEHPADLFRLQQQVLLLTKLGWSSELNSIKSHYVSVLQRAGAFRGSRLKVDSSEYKRVHALILGAFLALTPRVCELLEGVMKDRSGRSLDSGVREYQKFRGLVEENLSRAVVPSTVFDGRSHWYPGVVALLNASTKFYLESVGKLVAEIEGQNPRLPGHRSRWIKRLELLTAKALEDHFLLIRERGAVKSGGSFKRANLREAIA